MLTLVATSGAQYRWRERVLLPFGPSGKPVDDGGCLVAVPSESAPRIWAAKGNSTCDTYVYDVDADTWSVVAPVPLGVENKTVGIGARAAYDGLDRIFMLKGHYTQGFYCYSLSGDTWQQLPDVPLGAQNTKVQQGADLVYVNQAGHGYVYLLKGYWNEFYRYDVEAHYWEALAPAPVGTTVHWNDGSWLVYDGGNRIFAHKAYYHDFFPFRTDSLYWENARCPMPFIGRSGKMKRTSDGGCAALLDSNIYALKGNLTTEFWRYSVAEDSWSEADTIPASGSTGKVKRVSDGADIVSIDGRLYALKGNSCNEFWCYDPYLTGVVGPGPSALRRGTIGPNPVAGRRVCVNLPGLQTGVCRVTVCNAGGRVQQSGLIVVRDGQFGIDLSGVPAGAYVLRVSGPGVEFAEPLVVVK